MTDNVARNLGNFSRIPSWNAIFSGKEVDQLVDSVGDWIFCNGRIRNFNFKRVTENRFKVSTTKP